MFVSLGKDCSNITQEVASDIETCVQLVLSLSFANTAALNRMRRSARIVKNNVSIHDKGSEMCKVKLLVSIVLCLASSAANGYDFYVSPDGSDLNPATKSKPVYSLTQAYERARKLADVNGYPKDGITIWIAGGDYSFDETLVVDSAFFGTEDKPIVFKAYNGKPVFNGGKAVDLASAKPVEDESLLAGISPAGRGKVYSLVVKDGKLKAMLAEGGIRLSFNDRMMNLARYPNVGYAHIDSFCCGNSICHSCESRNPAFSP